MKLTVSGWKQCPYFQKAANVAAALEHMYGSKKVECEIIEFEDRDSYKKWLPSRHETLKGSEKHTSSPLSWTTESGIETFLGGCDDTLKFARNFNSAGSAAKAAAPAVKVGNLRGTQRSLTKDDPDDGKEYQYDLVVIGGGSGGLACAKAAAGFGAKVALLDAVKPSPHGTKWGLGGTCVNVGCIPKKLMHQAALLAEGHEDAKGFGWKFPEGKVSHNWSEMVTNVTNHIRSLNFGYRVQLREKEVEYINKLGKFKDPHTISLSAADGSDDGQETETITARRIVIAVGGRPTPLPCEGGELAISSDDIFWRKEDPGKVLVIGASYVALECAGFLNAMQKDVTVMVRSILLRGFDQDMANKIGDYMEKTGTKFIKQKVPTKLEKVGSKIRVHWDGGSDEFDTVFAAVGRTPDFEKLGLENAGVKASPKSGKLLTIQEQTNVPHIYAIGDVQEGHLELTPVAIESGKLLAARLYGNSKVQMDYRDICTTIFTPLEYGCCGCSEEEALELAGDAVEVYHTAFTPLEWTVPDNRQFNDCYCKVIVDSEDNNRVLGFHILSPNAGEITQGFGIGLKLGMNFQDLSSLVGIHPTVAEELTNLTIKKSSGESAVSAGC
mmetsp:Transcript_3982/g.4599  ORF Transcript_3982/g.4599 Transcript_3982/m.4599 type:complete len:611 (+) Transcript_3982:125-1957(+)|eukprot:CAMPEP_0184019620 /NCGR_PEP_ID=MMETSP0954-20121128/8855_1 /TAXON_ID=627963 /ORGANISM="Aplanochytrium sp, Strain PBS07" /LENGTH=610 /DNA_ID=CAMNT_0026301311 /DNA_START=99 /DNA_END=1931 /DNA_ORIENTATION=-